MRQNLLKCTLLLCALIVGEGTCWGDTVWERVKSISTLRSGGTFILGYEATANSGIIVPLRTDACAATTSANGILYSGTGTGTTSNNGTINMSSVTETAKYELYITASTIDNAINMQLGSSTGNYIGCPNSKNTAKIYATASANTAYTLSVGSNDIFTLECEAADTGDKYKFFKYNTGSPRFANYSTSPEKLVFYKKVEGSTPNCAVPTFSPAGGTYTTAQNVTISSTTEGATIYYTTNGDVPTTNSTIYSAAIPVNSTQTIMAIAVKNGYDNSSVASATYTILSKKTLSAVRSQATGDVYTQGIVTYVNGKTAYIQDNTAAIAVYDGTANLSVAVGDEIAVSGTLGVYNNLLQIQTPTINVLSQNNSVTPVVKTIEEIITDNAASKALQCMLVKIENATVTQKSGTTTTNATVSQGVNTIEVRNIAQGVNYAVNDKLTLQGNIGIYNNIAQIINPSEVVVTQNVNPAINVANNVTIDFDATSGEISYTIDNPTTATLTAVITSGDWISNIQVDAVNSKVTFTATTNIGAQRTATITLSYTGAEDKVVTITQNRNGVAALPFTFDGGRDDIATTYGITQDGLGTDYGSSPKLRFDHDGDYVILRINEAAEALSFKIKNNSFSGGTFTVQTSTDGISYSDIRNYTTITQTQTEAIILSEDVRYIKWIYTFKDKGNVALGDINLLKPTSVALSDALYTTYCNANKNIDFEGTGVKAYTVSNVAANSVTLTEVTKAPAGTPLLLKADAAGTYALNVTNAADAVGTNYLLVSDGTVTGGAGIYALANKTDGVGFYLVKNTVTIPVGKCYLNTGAITTKEFYPFDFDDATAITEVNGEDVKVNGAVYDLSGRQVQKPSKGIYLINGKKVAIK